MYDRDSESEGNRRRATAAGGKPQVPHIMTYCMLTPDIAVVNGIY